MNPNQIILASSDASSVIGTIENTPTPSWAADALTDPETAIASTAVTILEWILFIGALVCLAMIIWGAFSYMTSGGDKGKTAAARNRIIYAVIGLFLLSLSFAIAYVIQTIILPADIQPLQMSLQALPSFFWA